MNINFLLIEDEADFIRRIRDACAATKDIKLLTPEDVGICKVQFDTSSPIEEQVERHLMQMQDQYKIDLVILDTDLSHAAGELRTQTEYRKGFQAIGVPLCRYRKGQAANVIQTLERIKRIGEDGSSAIWVPNNLLQGASGALVGWMKKVCNGFVALSDSLSKDGRILQSKTPVGPPGILAEILGHPSLRTDLLGYTAQNFVYFGGVERDKQRKRERYVCQLGYWLYNHILTFPGPILNEVASAAYLNLTTESFNNLQVQNLIKNCRYAGPFHELDNYYWKDKLSDVLDGLNGDIATAPSIKGLELERIDKDTFASAYYCVLNREAITADDAAPNPDWIPAGATLARIKNSDLDELGPMLKI